MVRTQYMTMFKTWGEDAAKAALETERGLGNQFAACVKQLLKENPKATAGQLVAEYDVAMETLETAAKALLADEFGEKATLSKHFPEFRNYKSAYRTLLTKMGGEAATLEKFGPFHVKQKVAELNKPKKGETPDNKGPDKTAEGQKAGQKNQPKLDPKVQKHLDNFVMALEKLPPEEAVKIVEKSEGIAWGALKRATGKVAQFANQKKAS